MLGTQKPRPSLLIIGGGAFGTSTAYHLSKRGYNRVTVLDRFAPPSQDAAATDLNKTLRYDYSNEVYSELALEAMNVWKSSNHPLSGLFTQTGWVMAAGKLAKEFVDTTYEASKFPGIEYLTPQQLKQRWPGFTGALKDWTSLVSPEAGWALLRLALAAQANGVSYVHGISGQAIKLLYDDSDRCIGVLSGDGTAHLADVVLVAAGAQTGALIDVENELVARSMCVATIQLTPEEVKKYENLPMVTHFEEGIIFPPNESGLIKLCSCRIVTNYDYSPVKNVSVGRSCMDFPGDEIPVEIDRELRAFLSQTLPELANRPWAWKRMFWDASSKDSNFRICTYPRHKNLFVATGGSLHGFKFLPTVGKYIVDMIEGKLEKKYEELWQWKFGEDPPETTLERHPYPPRDLGQLEGWKGHNLKSSL